MTIPSARPARRPLGLLAAAAGTGRLLVLAGLILLATTRVASAGGGPENVFLVANARSVSSITIANYYAALRNIPPTNIMLLDYSGSVESIQVSEFRTKILIPILDAIAARGLPAQIDYVVYSSDFPYRVNLDEDWGPTKPDTKVGAAASITGLTYLALPVIAKNFDYTSLGANTYFRIIQPELGITPSQAFRSWYGWGNDGRLIEGGGNRYLLCTMLGYTAGRGNTLREVLDYLIRSARADGSRPDGTIYFMRNSDIRSTVRDSQFPEAVAQIKRLGIKAEILEGVMPLKRKDVAGLQTGTRTFNWDSTGSTIRPGAICDNFTSYGGVMSSDGGQTALSEFLRAGAAGSSGTVTEPWSIREKFPSPLIQVHYCRGCSLAEAFYQSVPGPYQLLIVGDALCQPWADIPVISVPDLKPGQTVTGMLSITPSGKSRKEPVDRFDLFIDGLKMADCREGEKLEYDTRLMPDGYHEVRVVGTSAGSIEPQGRLIIPINVQNHNRSMSFTATPASVPSGQAITVTVDAPGTSGVAIFWNNTVVGRINGPKGTTTLNSARFGLGPVELRAIGLQAAPTDCVIAAPVRINVTEAQSPGR